VGDCLRIPVGTSLAEIERKAIYATLDLCEGNKRRCAEMLGVSLKTLYNRLAEYQSGGVEIATV
jgi:DNA-binding NtrC family response regulator